MKLRCVIPTLVCMVCAAGFASAESGPFEVPAGDLIDAVESLAKQYGVDVLYSSALLKGRKTEGLNGTLEPVDAFRALLAGTPLVLREEGRSLLITQVAGAPPPTAAQSSPDQLAQVEIEGARHESLSAMLEELNELEERFYDEYNKVNDIPDLNVYCEHLPRKCQTVVAMRLQGRTGGGFPNPGNTADTDMPFVYYNHKAPPMVDFRTHALELIQQHPELRELLDKRRALMQRYLSVRKQKFKGRLIVWD